MDEPLGTPLISEEWMMSYPMIPASVQLARRHARTRLTLWEWPGNVDDAILVISELTTNAVKHARRPGHELWLRLTLWKEPEVLEIEVADPAATELPKFPTFPPEEAGRGLHLVNSLTSNLTWTTRKHVGKAVRAVLSPRG